jgi:trans-feruloyl-CoA hydratase/vanillin synthase
VQLALVAVCKRKDAEWLVRGGAFLPVVSCDLAIAAEEARFGLSEVNFGILPAGNASRALAETVRTRDVIHYIMTGKVFDGRKAAEMGLVNEAVPRDRLRERVREVADALLEKSPDEGTRHGSRLLGRDQA